MESNKTSTVIDSNQVPAPVDPVATAMTPDSVVRQVGLVQDVMKRVMHKGTHYDTIPGTQNPTLLKPGAEKLSMTFRFAPSYKITRNDMPDGHREYEVVCDIRSIDSEKFLGSGVGSATTMERKYRYRAENTGRDVPNNYWQTRDPELLGGSRFKAQKRGKAWVIVEQVEHDNPADYYNTVLKMAKKRAFVDAVLTVTAASDIFTQDVEDLEPEVPAPPSDRAEKTKPVQGQQSKKNGQALTEAEWATFNDKMGELGFTNPGRVLVLLNKAKFGLKSPEDLTRDRLKEAYEVLEKAAGEQPSADGGDMFDGGKDDDIPW